MVEGPNSNASACVYFPSNLFHKTKVQLLPNFLGPARANLFNFIATRVELLRPRRVEIISPQVALISPGYGEEVSASADSPKRQKVNEDDSSIVPNDLEVGINSPTRGVSCLES